MWKTGTVTISFCCIFVSSPLGAEDLYGEAVRCLREYLTTTLGPADAAQVPTPFELDTVVARRVKELTRDSPDTRGTCRRLLDFMLAGDEPGLAYDQYTSGTASDAYYARIGNCLARTSLFVGMARLAHLDARYVHVTEVNRFTEGGESSAGESESRNWGVVVHSSHVCAGIKDGGQLLLVDFVPGTTHRYRMYRVIDDVEALAHYFNNKGFEVGFLGAGTDPSARIETEMQSYELAIRIRPDFYPAYNNLGTAHRRKGELDRAIELYRQAIELNPRFADAHSNLAAASYAQGRSADAVVELKLAIQCDPANPYPSYALGNIYHAMGAYVEAEGCYQKAIANGSSPSFYVGLVRSRLALGKKEDALAALAKGLKANPTSRQLVRLSECIEQGGSGGSETQSVAPIRPPTPG